jgi:GNAT superfamily N-acetyltransferase
MGEVTKHPKARGGITAPARFNPQLHDVSGFHCEKPPLNEWLQNQAAKSEGTSARTYVVCEDAKVIGYFCLAVGSVARASLPSKIKHGQPDPVPVIVIGRLARDLSYRGTGLGGDLLKDALTRTLAASEIVGIRAVVVHVLDEEAIPFYRENGFKPLPKEERTFFLPIETIRAAL